MVELIVACMERFEVLGQPFINEGFGITGTSVFLWNGNIFQSQVATGEIGKILVVVFGYPDKIKPPEWKIPQELGIYIPELLGKSEFLQCPFLLDNPSVQRLRVIRLIGAQPEIIMGDQPLNRISQPGYKHIPIHAIEIVVLVG